MRRTLRRSANSRANGYTPSTPWPTFPGQRHRRLDLTSRDVSFVSVYQYMIVYRQAETVEIVGVLHGKRDAKRLIKARTSR
jgi:hypothetical protein